MNEKITWKDSEDYVNLTNERSDNLKIIQRSSAQLEILVSLKMRRYLANFSHTALIVLVILYPTSSC
ncbi:hypothetical protein EUGRSUZ_B00323 [Eucalyptus grandis]|uniref:Uncharacterized protein n=2 Tax=Eucalyptus grandis TaxID=71139 RepID=A0A059CY49_EUCGR|nr:hypothetical protein EUGRSUZ_B00323 [Eucalyptus grandis]